MENEDKRPEVWVARRLSRRGAGCNVKTVAYFASKAKIQNATIKYLRNGQWRKEYEVEFETPQALEELNFDSEAFAEVGDHVKVDRVFRTHSSCRDYVEALNKGLLEDLLANGIAAYADSIKEQHREDVAYAKKLENYFNKFHITIMPREL